MKQTDMDYSFTLDLDNIDYQTAYKRFIQIIKEQPVYKVVLYFSALKGFHISCFCFEKVNIARIRRLYKDDGNRLIHDLIDRSDIEIHDVLWQSKELGDTVFFQEKIMTWHK